MDFKLGDTAKVWPMPGARVQRHPDTFGQFLSEDGQEITFRDDRMLHWIHDLARSGSICFHDPKAKPAPLAASPISDTKNKE